jgi:hypothetical protein
VFNRRKDDANKLEIHFDLTNMKTGQPNSGVTGTGDAVRLEQILAAAARSGSGIDPRKLTAAENAFTRQKAQVLKMMQDRSISSDSPDAIPFFNQINELGQAIYSRLGVADYFVPDPIPSAPDAPTAAAPGYGRMILNALTPTFGGSGQPTPRPSSSGAVDPNNPLLRTN